ncbi:MAG: hypothetical protein ACK56I_21400, partial [bacterium]
LVLVGGGAGRLAHLVQAGEIRHEVVVVSVSSVQRVVKDPHVASVDGVGIVGIGSEPSSSVAPGPSRQVVVMVVMEDDWRGPVAAEVVPEVR